MKWQEFIKEQGEMGVISQQTIKAENKKRLYQLISGNSGISRACLASVTSLSKTTVSFLIEELIQEGRIVDQAALKAEEKGDALTACL